MARSDFVLFGAAHLAILSSVPAVAALLGWWGRRGVAAARNLRWAAGLFLLVNELVWYAFKYHRYHIPFPEGLPLQLCDLALWATIAACFTLKPWVFEVAYYTGLGGSAQAVLTPDLWEPFPSYPTIYFFLAHAGLMIVLLTLIWSGQARPRPDSLWRGFAAANLWAFATGIFNWVFGTNYMYLCRKPAGASLLDWFGPWPWYLAAGELMALAVFALLWLPFRQAPARNAVQ
jgi:hypothetical integral membrane protein (TIGR02206 family)